MSWFDQQGIPGYGGNTGVAGGRTRVVGGAPAAPAQAPITAQNVDSIGANDPRFNGTEYQNALNAAHPEYSGKPAAAPTKYAAIQGFDYDKITGAKAHDSDLKYSPALRAFSAALGSGVQIGRGNLGGAIDYAKANGFGNAKAVGDDKIDFGDGQGPIDVIQSNGSVWFQNGQDRFVPPGAPAGQAGNTVPLGSMGQASGGLAVGQSGHLGGHFDPFHYEKFVAPDVSEIDKDPYYQSRLQRGLGAVQASAASKGMLGDFKTLKALNDYAGTSASDEYQNIYNRAYQTNQANNSGRLGAFTANTNADLGYGNLDLGYTRAGNDYSLGLGNLALGNKQADNSFALGQGNLDLGWSRYGLDADQQQFGQGFSLAQMGLQAAGMAGGYGSGYSANGGGYITGAGNARAAGYVGAGGAMGGALSNIGGSAMGYGMYRGMNGRGSGGGYTTSPYAGPGAGAYPGENA